MQNGSLYLQKKAYKDKIYKIQQNDLGGSYLQVSL